MPGRKTQPFVPALAAAALVAVLVVFGAALGGTSAPFDPATLAASKSLEAKLQILESTDTQPSASYPVVIITEFEANSYLKVHSGESLPMGVRTPSLGI